ncbi:hypothetical protein ACHAL6_09120 [Proteiniclasticum sp. C24MP]|uniref:hypothetical protein n=1 Tax=Proteiniclasticum sp. C24MP TaxID=3374101 RepID=UPI0037545BF3
MDYNGYQNIRNWIYRNARPLDLARWEFHFEHRDSEEVLKMLSFYQNEDGGFGHGLEPDSWNPGSTPITTNRAAEILREIGHSNRKHPMIVEMLKYLESGQGKKGHKWLFSVPENSSYPHAHWWETAGEGTITPFNPTASILRFILDFGDYKSDLYMLALNEMESMKEEFVNAKDPSMHDLICLESIRAYLDEERLNKLEAKIIEKDPDNWKEYTCRPSAFIRDGSHPLLKQKEIKELLRMELDALERSLHSDGYWEINWSWGSYPEAFAVARNWWRADVTIRNLLLLKAFGRLEDL